MVASCAAPAVHVETIPSPPAIEEEPDPAVAAVAPITDTTNTEAEPTPPDGCAPGNAEGICSPPPGFVRRACGGFAKPDLALVLFAKGSPWTRAYLRLGVEAWYPASRSTKVALKPNEEVIVLYHPNPSGGIIVNGAGAPFDVIRLDGACATLAGDEVTLKRPSAPRHPSVPWRQLDPRVREALLSDPTVLETSAAYDEACREAATAACAKASTKLTAAILDFTARGGKVPMLLTRR